MTNHHHLHRNSHVVVENGLVNGDNGHRNCTTNGNGNNPSGGGSSSNDGNQSSSSTPSPNASAEHHQHHQSPPSNSRTPSQIPEQPDQVKRRQSSRKQSCEGLNLYKTWKTWRLIHITQMFILGHDQDVRRSGPEVDG